MEEMAVRTMALIGLPEQVWERADVLAACRARDANALLRLARRHGVTNERLAHSTGIDPGEISKRLSGKTASPVRTLDRWERIATGLGMSGSARLALGLAPRGPEPPPPGPAPRGPEPPLTPGRPVCGNELAELFAVFAEDTDLLYRPWLQVSLPASGGRAVDLGCGAGRWTGLLLDRYDDVLGVDVAAREIEMAAAAHPDARFEVRNLLDLTPDRDGRFDLVFSVNTVHHVRDHDRALPHLRSLCAPGGRVVVIDITDPGGWGTLDDQVADAFRDAEESYRQRSRDHRIAAKVLELHLHPAWLDHALADVPLTRPSFHRRYGAVFGGAEFTDLHRVISAMRWTSP